MRAVWETAIEIPEGTGMQAFVGFFAITIACATAFGSARFSGEKGVVPHRQRLAAGSIHSCSILDDGSLQCWGGNNAGQVGDGSLTNRLAPTPVIPSFKAVSISAGRQHSCAI